MKPIVLALALISVAGAASAQTKPAAPIGSADARVRLQTLGYKDVQDLRRGANGQWTAKATRGNVEKSVTVPTRGPVVAR